jgi:NAD(P)-dependent dehydrogenase (short-subunit alcohol dehydrogenase family)
VDLDGRVALVTGAARSIGEACARKLASDGARVAVLDIDADGAERVASSIGGLAVPVDVTDSASVDAAVATVVDRLGGLDIAVNNAGVTSEGALTGDLTDEGWRAILAVNLDGVFHCLRAEIGVMRERHPLGRLGEVDEVAELVAWLASDASSFATGSVYNVDGGYLAV